MTCKDCTHHDVCELVLYDFAKDCEDFIDKSKYIELPCKEVENENSKVY